MIGKCKVTPSNPEKKKELKSKTPKTIRWYKMRCAKNGIVKKYCFFYVTRNHNIFYSCKDFSQQNISLIKNVGYDGRMTKK